MIKIQSETNPTYVLHVNTQEGSAYLTINNELKDPISGFEYLSVQYIPADIDKRGKRKYSRYKIKGLLFGIYHDEIKTAKLMDKFRKLGFNISPVSFRQHMEYAYNLEIIQSNSA